MRCRYGIGTSCSGANPKPSPSRSLILYASLELFARYAGAVCQNRIYRRQPIIPGCRVGRHTVALIQLNVAKDVAQFRFSSRTLIILIEKNEHGPERLFG